MSMSRRRMLLGTVTSVALAPVLPKIVVASPARDAMAAVGSVADYADRWGNFDIQPFQRAMLRSVCESMCLSYDEMTVRWEKPSPYIDPVRP